MSSVYAFRCWTPSLPREASTFVLFSAPTAFDQNAVVDAISQETRLALAPEAAYLIYPQATASHAAAALLEYPETFAAFADDTIIGIYEYDQKGMVKLNAALKGAPPTSLPVDHLKRQGLTTLFRRRGGVLEASATAHFVKPSTRPSSRFLRASHALSEGAEIFFAAFWLLSYLGDDVEYVHLDTSSIASVILAALMLRGNTMHPTIRTFQSYDGLPKHPFSVDRSDLVVISASQSGNMAAEITKKVQNPARVITLFSSEDAPGQTQVICDIRYHPVENVHGFTPVQELPENPTTRPIRLISEHFLIGPEPVKSITPAIKPDPPPVVQSTLAELCGREVFIALRETPIADVRSSLWIDMEKLKDTDIFKKWVGKMVNERVPAAARAIVQIDDEPQSKILADALLAEIRAQGGDLVGVRILTLSDLESGERDWAHPESPIVVAGGPTGRGTHLLAASRALRRFAPKSHRIYLSPGTISSSRQAFELLSSNLRQPSYSFDSMFEIIADREVGAESWRDERLLLEDLQGDTPPACVEGRLAILRGAGEGRRNELFLEAPRGSLRLRENFAFWPSISNCSAASQADVFATISAILENLRSPAVPVDRRLVNDVQSHTVLNAETFSRYNDGIIQAAFLRGALPIELNYTDSSENSRLMLDLIRQMISYSNRPQGEALAEFLLAILLGRLMLLPRHLEQLQEILRDELPGATEMASWLADCIVNRAAKLNLLP